MLYWAMLNQIGIGALTSVVVAIWLVLMWLMSVHPEWIRLS